MHAWARGELRDEYQIASETQWFSKLSLALELKEVDEGELDRQRPLWIRDLLAMQRAMTPAKGGPSSALPPGITPLELVSSLNGTRR